MGDVPLMRLVGDMGGKQLLAHFGFTHPQMGSMQQVTLLKRPRHVASCCDSIVLDTTAPCQS